MLSLYSTIIENLARAVKGDPFWEPYLGPLSDGRSTFALHLAVMVEPFLSYMLEGRKTIESRFSVKRTAPFNRIHPGDVILLKKAGGPVVAICLARDTWFYRLDPDSWRTIKEDFASYICAQDPGFWQERERASFATLIKVVRVTPIEHIRVEKRDRRGWVVLTPDTQSPQLPLDEPFDESMASEPNKLSTNTNESKHGVHSVDQASIRNNDCASGLHTYHSSRKLNPEGHLVCKHCGADNIDWSRLHRRDLADSEYTFAQLATDRLRLEWWTREIDGVARKHALKKGLQKLEQATTNRLTRSVGGADPPFDGRQTPKAGNAIFYAQHALACCCRKCIQYWHGIPRGESLDSDALIYFTQLVMKFISLRIPEISDDSAGDHTSPMVEIMRSN